MKQLAFISEDGKRLDLPMPKLLPGDRCDVHNYRRKPKDGTQIWESGEIADVSTNIDRDEDGNISVWYKYTVNLDRRGKFYKGHSPIIQLFCCNDGIEPEGTI